MFVSKLDLQVLYLYLKAVCFYYILCKEFLYGVVMFIFICTGSKVVRLIYHFRIKHSDDIKDQLMAIIIYYTCVQA